MKSLSVHVKDVTSGLNQQKFDDLLESPLLDEAIALWRDFLDHLRNSNGQLSAFWMSYNDMVEDVLLGLLRASHEGDWYLHLHTIRTMIP